MNVFLIFINLPAYIGSSVTTKPAKQKYIHPFPARMAPEIAIKALEDLRPGDIILDPMSGSGTVLHHAAVNGFAPIGFDLDPLAVLMSRVNTSKVDSTKLRQLLDDVLFEIKETRLNEINLPWIDDDEETQAFIKFWFARKQINDLRKVSFVLSNYKRKYKNSIEVDALRIALSRIIITKKVGASLAWDISHSRPHKVKEENDYDVIDGFRKSGESIARYLETYEIKTKSEIKVGDARNLKDLQDQSVDKVITSPPYLNAIDYMRGNKFSLIWLGYSIGELRSVRSNSIGAERKLENSEQLNIDEIYKSIFGKLSLENKHTSMIKRYINDSILLMSEIARVLKKGKRATLVVGNSILKGSYIDNSEVFNFAGQLFGLELIKSQKREIPLNKRYLPVPKNDSNSLSKRMKHEVIMTFINHRRTGPQS